MTNLVPQNNVHVSSTQFLWVGKPSPAYLGPLLRVSDRLQPRHSPGLGSHWRLSWEPIHFEVCGVLGKIQFLRVVRWWGASAPH